MNLTCMVDLMKDILWAEDVWMQAIGISNGSSAV
jgi:hypothetical protein